MKFLALYTVMRQADARANVTDRQVRIGRRSALAITLGYAGLLGAQPARKSAYVGFLAPPVPDHDARSMFDELRSAMQRLGWTEGPRVHYLPLFPGEDVTRDTTVARIASLVQQLVAARVDVIVALNTVCARAAKEATATIPIVFLAERPVENGLVATLARPGGNATGVTYYNVSLVAKRLGLLTQAVPGVRRIAYLGQDDELYRAGQIAAKALGVELLLAPVERANQLERAFRDAPQADAWIIEGHSMLTSQTQLTVDLIARSKKPAIYGHPEFAEAGGLMAYTENRDNFLVDVASLVDRVLRGAKPAELPVQEPTRFRLVINRKAARALGITIAPSVMLQADEIIE